MLTPDDLRAMEPEEQTQLFEKLAFKFYGTNSYNEKVSSDFGVSKPTVFRWKRENNTPFAVIFALDAWCNSNMNYTRILADWQTLPEDLNQITRHLTRVATTLSTIARRMPPAEPDAGKSFDPEPE